jgi:hypothetical protein
MSDALARLKIQGRCRLKPADFDSGDKLYVAFDEGDINPDTGDLIVERIRFPDFSCNWSRFSEPADVRVRPGGRSDDGVYSLTVQMARYKELATTVHDPICKEDYENYAHVEIRELCPGESIYSEPPRGRKLRSSGRKKLRLEYRLNIVNNRTIELQIGQDSAKKMAGWEPSP